MRSSLKNVKSVTNNVVSLKVELIEEKDKVAKQSVEVKVHALDRVSI